MMIRIIPSLPGTQTAKIIAATRNKLGAKQRRPTRLLLKPVIQQTKTCTEPSTITIEAARACVIEHAHRPGKRSNKRAA